MARAKAENTGETAKNSRFSLTFAKICPSRKPFGLGRNDTSGSTVRETPRSVIQVQCQMLKGGIGDPRRNRTLNLLIRSQLLYPVELSDRTGVVWRASPVFGKSKQTSA